MRNALATGIIALVVLVSVLAGDAEAYPQFQMRFDKTCSGCHLSPSGGGLLSENGMLTAESTSQYGTDPETLYGAWTPPEWLAIGGDFRAMYGYLQAPQRYIYGFPMQADLYANARKGNFDARVTVGMRPAQVGNEALTRVWAREHYVSWNSDPGNAEGLWLRAGHFMPVFGLRLAEHPAYTRRYGGTPLFAETYGVTMSNITEKYEVHGSAFIENPLMDSVLQSNGGALYAEMRPIDRVQVGAGAMITASDWEKKYRGTLTAKYHLPSPDILVQGELQIVNPQVGNYGFTQLVGYVMGSYFLTDSILIDVALGHYDENVRVTNLDRNALDVNLRWFVTSHFDVMLVTRYEQLGIVGDGGPFGAWSFLQAHYRL